MTVDLIVQDYQRTTGNPAPEIDVFGIMTSGKYLAGEIGKWLGARNISHRALLLYPKPEADRMYGGFNFSSSDAQRFRSLQEQNKIPPELERNEFWEQVNYRLYEAAISEEKIITPGDRALSKPDNLVLLVDDLIFDGGTMSRCVQDLIACGYDPAKMYHCALGSELGSGGDVWHVGKPDFHPYWNAGRLVSDAITNSIGEKLNPTSRSREEWYQKLQKELERK